MKYEVGDKVRIKSLDWYNNNKDEYGYINCGSRSFFTKMRDYCGKIVTIKKICKTNCYHLEEYDFDWTDEMIEGLVEEEIKPEPKFKVGDKVLLDPYPCVVTDVNWRDSLHGFAYTVRGANFEKMVGEADLIFDTSEETPKFKVNDIVFVKNIGWVRITNSYWDSLANECIYEAIGLNGEGEYDCISQSNIECQMLPESENPHTGGNKITLDEYKNNNKEWLFNKLAMLDNITALESIQDIFNHLQQSKYPKTYEECCKVLDIEDRELVFNGEYRASKLYWKQLGRLNILNKLLICCDAYWKITGEKMGLGKPWEPDWKDDTTHKFIIHAIKDKIHCGVSLVKNHLLAFPTEEMRDAFYENFKEEIEKCKELL